MKVTVEMLNNMLMRYRENADATRPAMDFIVCSDGERLSVQASKYHYCHPRDNIGPWEAVEVGFPTFDPPASWEDYIEGNWEMYDRKDTVYGYIYGYIPIELVVETINEHGGLFVDDVAFYANLLNDILEK